MDFEGTNMEEFKLRKNAELVVRSASGKDEVLETEGSFRGHTMLSQFSALIIQLPGRKMKGRENIRLIPEHMVLSIDVVKNGKKEDGEEKDDEPHSGHYA